MRYLTFALTKGRLADKTLAMLEKIGITCEEMKDKDSRKLIFLEILGVTVFMRQRTILWERAAQSFLTGMNIWRRQRS